MSAFDLLLTALFFLVAVLYSSVGHGGSSGYQAVMALCGATPAVIRPTALVLNILVSALATWKFQRAGYFVGRLFWPFVLASAPAAFLGGLVKLPDAYFRPLLGVILLYAALRLAIGASRSDQRPTSPPGLPVALVVGALIGLLSGLTGTGGGIFLTPLMLLAHWATPRQSAAASAAFILVNSVSGLLGWLRSAQQVELPALPYWGAAALVGGYLGAHLGSRYLVPLTLRRLLALVLVLGGVKLLFPAPKPLPPQSKGSAWRSAPSSVTPLPGTLGNTARPRSTRTPWAQSWPSSTAPSMST